MNIDLVGGKPVMYTFNGGCTSFTTEAKTGWFCFEVYEENESE